MCRPRPLNLRLQPRIESKTYRIDHEPKAAAVESHRRERGGNRTPKDAARCTLRTTFLYQCISLCICPYVNVHPSSTMHHCIHQALSSPNQGYRLKKEAKAETRHPSACFRSGSFSHCQPCIHASKSHVYRNENVHRNPEKSECSGRRYSHTHIQCLYVVNASGSPYPCTSHMPFAHMIWCVERQTS